MTVLGILANTEHYRLGDDLYILGPVAAQLDRIGSLFDRALTCAPLYAGTPPRNFQPYLRGRVRLRPLRPAGGSSVRAKLALAARALTWIFPLRRTARDADFIHLRCPCNVALVALLVVPPCVPWYALYAGTWAGYEGEPWSNRLQRWLLRHRRNGIVTVYARGHEEHAPNIIPFFSPTHTQQELADEAGRARLKVSALLGGRCPSPLRVVSVGHLSPNKNHGTAIRAVALARAAGCDVELDIAGDGPLLDELRSLVAELELDGVVRLHGLLSRGAVQRLNREAHVTVLISRAEGYGKVVLEGMAAGTVPLLSQYPLAFEFAGDGSRGIVVDGSRSEAVAEALQTMAREPVRLGRMAEECLVYARERSLEAFVDRLAHAFAERWPGMFGDGAARRTGSPDEGRAQPRRSTTA